MAEVSSRWWLLPLTVGEHKPQSSHARGGHDKARQDGSIGALLCTLALLALITSLTVAHWMSLGQTRPITTLPVNATLCILMLLACGAMWAMIRQWDDKTWTNSGEGTPFETSSGRQFFINHLTFVVLCIFFGFGALFEVFPAFAQLTCMPTYYQCNRVTENLLKTLTHISRITFNFFLLTFAYYFEGRLIEKCIAIRYCVLFVMLAILGNWFDLIFTDSFHIFFENPEQILINQTEYIPCTVNVSYPQNTSEFECLNFTTSAFNIAHSTSLFFFPFTVEFSLIAVKVVANIYANVKDKPPTDPPPPPQDNGAPPLPPAGGGGVCRDHSPGPDGRRDPRSDGEVNLQTSYQLGERAPDGGASDADTQYQVVASSNGRAGAAGNSGKAEDPEGLKSTDDQTVVKKSMSGDKNGSTGSIDKTGAKGVESSATGTEDTFETNIPGPSSDNKTSSQAKDSKAKPTDNTQVKEFGVLPRDRDEDTESVHSEAPLLPQPGNPSVNQGRSNFLPPEVVLLASRASSGSSVSGTPLCVFFMVVVNCLFVLSAVLSFFHYELTRKVYSLIYWFPLLAASFKGLHAINSPDFKSAFKPYTSLELLIVISLFGTFFNLFLSWYGIIGCLTGSQSDIETELCTAHGNEALLWLGAFKVPINFLQIFTQVTFMVYSTRVKVLSERATDSKHFWWLKQSLLYCAVANVFLWMSDTSVTLYNMDIQPGKHYYYGSSKALLMIHLTTPFFLFFRFNSALMFIQILLTHYNSS